MAINGIRSFVLRLGHRDHVPIDRCNMIDMKQMLLDTAQDANRVYLEAYRVGYEAGFKAATEQALKLIEAPLADAHLKVVK